MMKISTRQTWDEALARRLGGADGRRVARTVLAVVVAVAAGVGFLPNVASAHDYQNPGFNGALLFVEMNEGKVAPFQPQTLIKGKDFAPDRPVEIYQCPSSAPTDPRMDCVVAGTALTDATGFFQAKVVASAGMPAKNTYCAPIGTSQCYMVAATYASDKPAEMTSDAEHDLCFSINFAWVFFPAQYFPARAPYEECAGPPAPIETTTTTTAPLPNQWELAAPMKVARYHLATAVGADGRIYALGGSDTPNPYAVGNALSVAEVLEPCGDRTWSPIAPMPTARTQFAAAAGPDGRIYAIGGRNALNGTPLATVDAYDPDDNTWSTVASLSMPRASLAATTGPDGLIYAIGGMVASNAQEITFQDGAPATTVEVYDTDTNQWQLSTPLPLPHGDIGAATGPDERVYAIAGDSVPFTNTFDHSVWSYSPAPAGTPGTWRQEESPSAVGNFPTDTAVTAGPDGLIYAIGGDDYGRSMRSVWSFNTAPDRTAASGGAWTISQETMMSRRWGNGAAAGKDGRMYAMGGIDWDYDNPPPPMASTEAVKVAPSTCPLGPPPPADFDASETTDYSVFRPSTGTWFVKDGLTLNYGTEGDIPVPGDYDGDRKADVAVFRPSSGVWFVRNSTGGDTALAYGTSGDIPVPADYDGDGKADIAVFRPSSGVWFIHYSGGGDAALPWGTSGDVAVPADYDGDDKADIAVFRNGTWFIRPTSGAADITVNYGTTGDIPVPGDYEADTAADIAVFRPSNGFWFLRHSSDGAQEAFAFGTDGDIPVPGDYNGDAIADPAVFRPSSGVWFVEIGVSAAWGTSTDIPLPLPAAVRMAYFTS